MVAIHRARLVVEGVRAHSPSPQGERNERACIAGIDGVRDGDRCRGLFERILDDRGRWRDVVGNRDVIVGNLVRDHDGDDDRSDDHRGDDVEHREWLVDAGHRRRVRSDAGRAPRGPASVTGTKSLRRVGRARKDRNDRAPGRRRFGLRQHPGAAGECRLHAGDRGDFREAALTSASAEAGSARDEQQL